MISHAIFASSHLTSPRTASSSTPPSTPCFAPHLALHFTPHPTLHFTLHPTLRSPAPHLPFTLRPDPHSHPYPSAKSLLPPIVKPLPPSHSNFFPSTNFPSASLHPSLFLSQVPSPCALTPFPTTHFHRTSLLPRIPLAKSLPPRHSIFLPSIHFPSACLSTLRVPQPSPFTPHPIMPFTLRPDPIPHRPFSSHFFAPQDSFSQVPPSTSLHLPPVHPFPIRVSPPSVSLSQAPPVDFLVRKKARLTHDMTFFHHDVRRKRFNTHEGPHNMEMIISKDNVAEVPRLGWDLWRHGRP